MRYPSAIAVLLLTTPSVTHAQGSLQIVIENIILFLGEILFPALLVFAFVFLVFNVIRYFVTESSNEDGRKNARALAIYGTLAFVFFVLLWGIVNLLTDAIGLGGEETPCPDYIRQRNPELCITGGLPPTCPDGTLDCDDFLV